MKCQSKAVSAFAGQPVSPVTHPQTKSPRICRGLTHAVFIALPAPAIYGNGVASNGPPSSKEKI